MQQTNTEIRIKEELNNENDTKSPLHNLPSQSITNSNLINLPTVTNINSSSSNDVNEEHNIVPSEESSAVPSKESSIVTMESAEKIIKSENTTIANFNTNEIICLDDDDEEVQQQQQINNHIIKANVCNNENALIITNQQQQELNTYENQQQQSTNNQNLKIISIIENIAFEKISSSDVKYYCNINKCKFSIINDENQFKLHLENEHNQITWKGFCKICEKSVTNRVIYSIHFEINHMINEHLDTAYLSSSSLLLEPPPSKKPRLSASTSASSLSSISNISNNNELLDCNIIKNLLKPWLNTTTSKKTKLQCEKMLSHKSLSALYKCMGINCNFTTNIRDKMFIHIQAHNNEITIGSNNTYLECCYCDLKFIKSDILLDHIDKTHNICNYQCTKCFYRSIDAYNIITHFDLYHKNNEKSLQIDYILFCCCIKDNKDITEIRSNFSAREILRYRAKNIKPITCQGKYIYICICIYIFYFLK